MDFSPVLISLKTAVPSIAVTFFLGLFLAWGVVAPAVVVPPAPHRCFVVPGFNTPIFFFAI